MNSSTPMLKVQHLYYEQYCMVFLRASTEGPLGMCRKHWKQNQLLVISITSYKMTNLVHINWLNFQNFPKFESKLLKNQVVLVKIPGEYSHNNPNTIKSYKILQKLSPKHAAHGVAQSTYPNYRHGKACLSKQPPWRAAGDPRLARGRSRV